MAIVRVCVIDVATLLVTNIALFEEGTIWEDTPTTLYRYRTGSEWIGWSYDPATNVYTPPPPPPEE